MDENYFEEYEEKEAESGMTLLLAIQVKQPRLLK